MGSPFSQYQLLKKTTASSSAMRVVLVGIIRTSEFKRSVIVRIQSKLLSGGSGLMKSMETELQCSSGIGNGCKGPEGLEVELLFGGILCKKVCNPLQDPSSYLARSTNV